MSFLHVLTTICSILIFGFALASVKVDVDYEFVTFCAPMGFLVAAIYACFYLDEKRKHASEKKPLMGFMKVFQYVLLVCYVLSVCASLMLAGLAGSFLPLITGATFFLAAAAIFFYIEESRKGAPLEKGEEQSSDIHG